MRLKYTLYGALIGFFLFPSLVGILFLITSFIYWQMHPLSDFIAIFDALAIRFFLIFSLIGAIIGNIIGRYQ